MTYWLQNAKRPRWDHPTGAFYSQHIATFDLAMWREREGVEPPEDIEGCPPSGLKSVEPTRAHTLPW